MLTQQEILRFKELDARWRGERLPDKPTGLTGDEPTEHRRLASKLARAYVMLVDETAPEDGDE